jgi:opacity protein-like surface antigen
MRSRLLLAVVAAAAPSAVRAQAPHPAPPAAPPVTVNQTVVIDEGGAPVSHEPFLGLDLMVGQLSGVRPSFAVFRDTRSALVIEGFYGGIFSKLGQSEGAGAGLRYNLTRGGRDAVTLGPGVDVLFNFRDGQATMLAPTIDLAWKRDFGERAGWVLGMNAGVGVGVSGRTDTHGGSAGGRVTPLISVFGGLRF